MILLLHQCKSIVILLMQEKTPGFRNREKSNWCGVFEKGPCLPSNSILLYHLNNESSAHNGSTLQKRPYNLNAL